mmetsp:Transcript_38330/g.120667  ORF Transcript_38330/g.120667 Transcript_38330/m.120667 type:complete len:330 (+) Transcript_38330:2472-3461(+)
MSVAAGRVQARVTSGVDGVEICLSLDEEIDHLGVSHEGCDMQDARLVAISGVDLTPGRQQQLDAFLIAIRDDGEERRFAQVVELSEVLEDQPLVLADLQRESLAILFLILVAKSSEEVGLHEPMEVEDRLLGYRSRHPIPRVVVQPEDKLAQRHLLELGSLQHGLGIVLVVVEPRGRALGIEVHELLTFRKDGGLDLVMTILHAIVWGMREPSFDPLARKDAVELSYRLVHGVSQKCHVQLLPFLNDLLDGRASDVGIDLQRNDADGNAGRPALNPRLTHDLKKRERREQNLIFIRVLRQEADRGSAVNSPVDDLEDSCCACPDVLQRH